MSSPSVCIGEFSRVCCACACACAAKAGERGKPKGKNILQICILFPLSLGVRLLSFSSFPFCSHEPGLSLFMCALIIIL
ncbi:hypothetical protein K504DRAFT_93825 [Pleomassaria siparia CBS 279.74]|uniref:Uncharacterized protein n=1 Tax=Pleomassaria siparia CBS 279.74 TaxID=1314801 RepID=A0A6G1JZN3_9PLEO|nr:hypothetical protein K504DRAFT_93825 [Pleomassaria siparia CBS 279.74]